MTFIGEFSNSGLVSLLKGRGHYFFNGPSIFVSPSDSPFREAKFSIPLGPRESFSGKGKFHSSTGIVHLLFLCSPSAIARFVIAIIVDAIYGMTFWLFSHIFKKTPKIK